MKMPKGETIITLQDLVDYINKNKDNLVMKNPVAGWYNGEDRNTRVCIRSNCLVFMLFEEDRLGGKDVRY